MASLLFCHFRSDRIDLRMWNGSRAQLHCLTCGHHAWLEGFTISEFDPTKLLTAAIVDQAFARRRSKARGAAPVGLIGGRAASANLWARLSPLDASSRLYIPEPEDVDQVFERRG